MTAPSLLAVLLLAVAIPRHPQPPSIPVYEGSAHRYSFRSLIGQRPFPLSAFAGNAVLLVNTPARCEAPRQLLDMERVRREYGGRGLVILAVPTTGFKAGGVGTGDGPFCHLVQGYGFSVVDTEEVRGADAHPFFRWVDEAAGGQGAPAAYFFKYLIDREGRLVRIFDEHTSFYAPKLRTAIETVLDKK